MKKVFDKRFFIFIFAFFLLVVGCQTTQERLLDSDTSQVKLRNIQTRAFDTTDKEKNFANYNIYASRFGICSR